MRSLRWIVARFVIFALACLVVLVLLANTMMNQVAGGTRAYTADFTNVSGLRPGDDVRAAGVKVGRVQSVELHEGVARVSFDLAKKQPLYSDTKL